MNIHSFKKDYPWMESYPKSVGWRRHTILAGCNKSNFVKAVIRLASAGRITAHPDVGARPHPLLLLVPPSNPVFLLAGPHRTISWLLLWSMERALEFVDKFLTYCNSWPWNAWNWASLVIWRPAAHLLWDVISAAPGLCVKLTSCNSPRISTSIWRNHIFL